MINTHKIEIDLSEHNSIQPPVDMVQGDEYSRCIEITLVSDGVPWEPPEGARVQVGYTRADGTQWTYDELPNGDPAGSIAGNVVSVTIAPQVLSKAGKVDLAVTLLSGDTQISTFPVMLQVTARPGYGGGNPVSPAPTYTVEVEVE